MRAMQETSHQTAEDRIASVTEEYEQLLEMHQEYGDLVLDADEPEVHELWREIETKRRQLLGRIRTLGEGRGVSPESLDELEDRIDDLNESYWDLAALL